MENQKDWKGSSSSFITKDSGLSSGGGVIFKDSQNKPQGFDRARRAKSGFYQCKLDCETYFRTVEEAADHFDCPKREKLDKELSQMEAQLAPDGTFKHVPLTAWTKEEVRLFRKYLQQLPKDNRASRVQEFLNRPETSTPNMHYLNVIEEETRSMDANEF